MMFQLKTISSETIPRALARVERYRLLNEPEQAESICLDILGADPSNQEALVSLLLAVTDQFNHDLGSRVQQAREVLPRLENEYDRAYYAGIISERAARAHLAHAAPGSGYMAYEGLRGAMDCYEKAETVRLPGNDDAILRWNSCARTIEAYHLEPELAQSVEYPLE
jgi:hypothetical protein